MSGNRYLLDTTCLLWFQNNHPKLSRAVLDIIRNPAHEVLFSQISLFEVAIKKAIGKLPEFKADSSDIYQQGIDDSFEFLSIANEHIRHYERLPVFPEHRDPFDRLLIATAITENATILTADRHFGLYAEYVSVLW